VTCQGRVLSILYSNILVILLLISYALLLYLPFLARRLGQVGSRSHRRYWIIVNWSVAGMLNVWFQNGLLCSGYSPPRTITQVKGTPKVIFSSSWLIRNVRCTAECFDLFIYALWNTLQSTSESCGRSLTCELIVLLNITHTRTSIPYNRDRRQWSQNIWVHKRFIQWKYCWSLQKTKVVSCKS